MVSWTFESYLHICILLFTLFYSSKCTRYIGCYKENSVEARLMADEQRNFPNTLTPEKCINHCRAKGYGYAGLQYAFECYCSRERPPYTSLANEDECSTKCDGDSKKTCGANLRLSVYDIQDKRINYVQSLYDGCYADEDGRRVLAAKMINFPDTLTPEFCVGLCFRHGYRYAGLQYGTQCFCDDKKHGPKVSEGDCDMDCSGDGRFKCGGGWRNSVYETSIKDESEDGGLLGCFKDTDSFRILSGYQIILQETNSPRRCMNLCKQLGFKFSGVEDSRECFCGNKQPDSELETRENECLAVCPGDRTRRCGGSWRLLLHSTSIKRPTVIAVVDSGVGGSKPALVTPVISGSGTQSLIEPPPGVVVVAATSQPPVATYRPPSSSGGSGVVSRPSTGTGTVSRPSAGTGTVSRPSAGTGTVSRPSAGTGVVSRPSVGVVPRPVVPISSSSCTRSSTVVAGQTVCRGQLLFKENFSGGGLDPSKWTHDILMPWEPDYDFVMFLNQPENVYIREGKLHIRPTLLGEEVVRSGTMHISRCTGRPGTPECDREASGYSILPPIVSARITTRNSLSFTYGVVQIRARLPVGNWIVPQLWLEPKSRTVYGPYYKSGRIRIAMSRGNTDLVSASREVIGVTQLESGVVMGTDTDPNNVRGRKVVRINKNGWHQKFHNYTLIWTPDNLSFLVDGEHREDLIPQDGRRLADLAGFDRISSAIWHHGSSIAPFDQEFYVSIGVSVGGMKEFPNGCYSNGLPKPWENDNVKAMADFWLAKNTWSQTWNERSLLEVEHVTVTAL